MRRRVETRVAFRLFHPLVQRLAGTADLGCDRQDRRPARRVLRLVFQHHPHHLLANLRRKFVRRLALHRSTLSGVGASCLSRIAKVQGRPALAQREDEQPDVIFGIALKYR
jgi:hypothetical protein